MTTRRHIAVSLMGILVGSVFAAPARALDVVYRRSTSRPTQGTITDDSRTSISVKARLRKTPEVVPVNDIVRVRFDGEPASLNLNRIDEAGGRLKRALDGYVKAFSDSSLTNERLKTDLEFLIARVTAKLALVDPALRKQAVAKLEAFRKTHSGSFRYYETLSWLAKVYMAQRNFTAVPAVFASLEKAPWHDYQMAARIGKARLLLLQNQLNEAQAAFQAVIGEPAKGPFGLARRYEAQIGKATCLQRQKRYADAVKELENVIQHAPAEASALQAEAYLRQGDNLEALGKTKEAVMAYLHVDLLFSQEKPLHAEALYHLVRLWAAVGKPGRAADARARLTGTYPNSPWSRKLQAGG